MSAYAAPPLFNRESPIARYAHISKYGFAQFNAETADAMAEGLKGLRVIEVGAGLGYISASLAARDISILAYDAKIPYADWYGLGWETASHFHVEELDVTTLEEFDCDVVIMAWPCYDTPFAFEVAKRLTKGQTLVYLGESKGGCTGNDDFFEYVESDMWVSNEAFANSLNKHHRPFLGIHDWWHVYRRK